MVVLTCGDRRIAPLFDATASIVTIVLHIPRSNLLLVAGGPVDHRYNLAEGLSIVVGCNNIYDIGAFDQ